MGRPVKFIVEPSRDDFESLREFLIHRKEEQFYREVTDLDSQVNQGISKFFRVTKESKNKFHKVIGKVSTQIRIIRMYLRIIKAFKSGGKPRFALFFEHPPSMLLLQLKSNTLKSLIDKQIAKVVHEMIYSPVKILFIWYYKNFIAKVKMLNDQDLIIEYLKQVIEQTSKWISGAYPNKKFIMWPKEVNPCSTVYLSSFGDLAISTPRVISPESLINIDEFKSGQYTQIDKGTAGLLLDLIEMSSQDNSELIKALKEIKEELIPMVKNKRKKEFLIVEYNKTIRSLKDK
jgi:hypothetical protein